MTIAIEKNDPDRQCDHNEMYDKSYVLSVVSLLFIHDHIV